MRKFKSAIAAGLAFTIFASFLPFRAFAHESGRTLEHECCAEECTQVISDNVEVSSRLWELFFGSEKSEPLTLCPGGDVFGIKIKQSGVTVTEAKGIPALKCGDTILSINGKKVSSSNDIREELSKCHGESVTVRALHSGSEIAVEIRPTLVDGEYKLGMTLRDGAAGIGTMTFIDPESGVCGGLGHAICDSDSGQIVAMENGEMCGVVLGGVHRGESGKPGELCGILTEEHLGTLTKNCECGVFGKLDSVGTLTRDAVTVGTREELHAGSATIISTIKNAKSAEYSIEISDIDTSSTGSKSFKIKVTDPTLIALTGGIVRGMSGSPIIQDGKLVGAVTHVMVADPTEGYGIFIENMLSASQTTRNELPKSA